MNKEQRTTNFRRLTILLASLSVLQVNIGIFSIGAFAQSSYYTELVAIESREICEDSPHFAVLIMLNLSDPQIRSYLLGKAEFFIDNNLVSTITIGNFITRVLLPVSPSQRFTLDVRLRSLNNQTTNSTFELVKTNCLPALKRNFSFFNSFQTHGHATVVDSNDNLWVAGDGRSSVSGKTAFPVTPGAHKTVHTPQGWFDNDARVVKFCGISGVIDCATFIGGGDHNTLPNEIHFKAEDIISMAADKEGFVYVAGISTSPDAIPKDKLPLDASYNGLRPDGSYSRNTFVAKIDPTCNMVWGTFLGNTNHNNPGRITISEDGKYLFVVLDAGIDAKGQYQTISDGTYAPQPQQLGRGAVAKIDTGSGKLVSNAYYAMDNNMWNVNGHMESIVFVKINNKDFVLVASHPHLPSNQTGGIKLHLFSANDLDYYGSVQFGTRTSSPSLTVIPTGSDWSLYLAGDILSNGSLPNVQRNPFVSGRTSVFVSRIRLMVNNTAKSISIVNSSPTKFFEKLGTNCYAPNIVSYQNHNNSDSMLYLSYSTDALFGITSTNAHRPSFDLLLPHDRGNRVLTSLSATDLENTTTQTYVTITDSYSGNRTILENKSLSSDGRVIILTNGIPSVSYAASKDPNYISPQYSYKNKLPYARHSEIDNLEAWEETVISVFCPPHQNCAHTLPPILYQGTPTVTTSYNAQNMPNPNRDIPEKAHSSIVGALPMMSAPPDFFISVDCPNARASIFAQPFCGMYEFSYGIEVYDILSGNWHDIARFPAWATNPATGRPLREDFGFPIQPRRNKYRIKVIYPDGERSVYSREFEITCCDTNHDEILELQHAPKKLCVSARSEHLEINLSERDILLDDGEIQNAVQVWTTNEMLSYTWGGQNRRQVFVTAKEDLEGQVILTYRDSCGLVREIFPVRFVTRVGDSTEETQITVCPGQVIVLGEGTNSDPRTTYSWLIPEQFYEDGGSEVSEKNSHTISVIVPSSQLERRYLITRVSSDGCNTKRTTYYLLNNTRLRENLEVCLNQRLLYTPHLPDGYEIISVEFTKPDDGAGVTVDLEDRRLSFLITDVQTDADGVPARITAEVRIKTPCNTENILEINLRPCRRLLPESMHVNLKVCDAVTDLGNYLNYFDEIHEIVISQPELMTINLTERALVISDLRQSFDGSITVRGTQCCKTFDSAITFRIRYQARPNMLRSLFFCEGKTVASLLLDKDELYAEIEEPVQDGQFIYQLRYDEQTGQQFIDVFATNPEFETPQTLNIPVFYGNSLDALCGGMLTVEIRRAKNFDWPGVFANVGEFQGCTNSTLILNLPSTDGVSTSLELDPNNVAHEDLIIIDRLRDTQTPAVNLPSSGGRYQLLLRVSDNCNNSWVLPVGIIVNECCDLQEIARNTRFIQTCVNQVVADGISLSGSARPAVLAGWGVAQSGNQLISLPLPPGCDQVCVILEELVQRRKQIGESKPGFWSRPGGQRPRPPFPPANIPTFVEDGEPFWRDRGVFANGQRIGTLFPSRADGFNQPLEITLAYRFKIRPSCDSTDEIFTQEFYLSELDCSNRIPIDFHLGGGPVLPLDNQDNIITPVFP